MNQFMKAGLQFDYFSDNFKRFENDYYKYSTHEVPLNFLTDDMLASMDSRKLDYFKLRAKSSKDGKGHTYHFKTRVVEEGKAVIVYEYVGCDLER